MSNLSYNNNLDQVLLIFSFYFIFLEINLNEDLLNFVEEKGLRRSDIPFAEYYFEIEE